jgi:hypothetical protein
MPSTPLKPEAYRRIMSKIQKELGVELAKVATPID